MIDFDAKRVQDLFKDEEKSELKEGITTRDINSIASMTPLNRQDLQEDLQRAYKLIYDKNASEMGKISEMPKLPSSNMNITSQPTLGAVPSVAQTIQQQQQQQQQPTDKKPMAEQFMDMYNKIKEEKVENKPTNPTSTPTVQQQPQLSSYQDYVNRIKELENLNIEKDKEIELLKNEKEELLNQQYELENKHLEKYKELNNKYEDLQKEVSSTGDSLVDYLKQVNERLEQKQSLLLQEIGKLKGMLGI